MTPVAELHQIANRCPEPYRSEIKAWIDGYVQVVESSYRVNGEALDHFPEQMFKYSEDCSLRQLAEAAANLASVVEVSEERTSQAWAGWRRTYRHTMHVILPSKKAEK